MKRIFTALSFFLSLPLLLNAQSNYKKGWVVNLQGDTLKGFIDYREWDQNPKVISFKNAIESKSVQDFTPTTSQCFAVDGFTAYERYEGRISMDKVDIRRLSTAPDTSSAKAIIFLKVLQEGKNISLYSYRDEHKDRYFLKQNNAQKPQELIYKRYLTNNGTLEAASSKEYAIQLWQAAASYNLGSPELKRRIELAQYTEADLLSISSRINNISKQERAKDKENSPRLRYFAGIGINRGSLKSEAAILSISDNTSQVSFMPKVSVGVDAFLNPDVQRVVLRSQLSYAITNLKFTSENNWAEYKFRQNTASFLPQIIYNAYNKDNLKFNVGGGINLNHSTYPKNVYKRETRDANGNVVSTTERNNLYYYKSLWYGFMLRSGIVVNNKIDLSILYFLPGKIAVFTMNTIHLEVNYLFNMKGK